MNGEKATYRMTSDGVLLNFRHTFDLSQIADSGQCFRLTALRDGGYVAVTGMDLVKITPYADGGYVFHCSYDEFMEIWVPYFDLSSDYEEYQQQMVDDPFLKEAIAAGGGIRILRQDLWETVVTFIISQRNNIPRIRKSVDILCQTFGSPLREINGQKFYSFPTPAQLRGHDLSSVSLGYRESYVKDLTEYDEDFWMQLREQDDDMARKTLTSLRGVGEKVANCIMLFGLHRMNSYPRDVWINRMIEDVYQGSFDPSQYAGFAGYVQQLQFFYYRKTGRRKACDS